MAELDIKGKAAAEAWQEKATNLNNRTQDKLTQVSACLQELQTESVGDMVDQIAEAGAEMLAATAKMMDAMSKMVSMVKDILTALGQAVDAVIETITANKSTINMGFDS
jgi:hypothetical protein